MDATGLTSGTVYPALERLESARLAPIEVGDEDAAHAEGRPARRYFTLTAPAPTALRAALEKYQALRPLPGFSPEHGMSTAATREPRSTRTTRSTSVRRAPSASSFRRQAPRRGVEQWRGGAVALRDWLERESRGPVARAIASHGPRARRGAARVATARLPVEPPHDPAGPEVRLADVRPPARRSRGVAVLILALGIGANTTIFSWMQALLFSPLAGVARQDRHPRRSTAPPRPATT